MHVTSAYVRAVTLLSKPMQWKHITCSCRMIAGVGQCVHTHMYTPNMITGAAQVLLAENGPFSSGGLK